MPFNYCCKFPHLRCLLGVLATPLPIIAFFVTLLKIEVFRFQQICSSFCNYHSKNVVSRRKIISKEKLNCIPLEKDINSPMFLTSKYFDTVSYSLCARTIFKNKWNMRLIIRLINANCKYIQITLFHSFFPGLSMTFFVVVERTFMRLPLVHIDS